MKVSIVHPERRCAQQIALEVVQPENVEAFALPERLLPTHRHEFVLPLGVLLAFVASACMKQHGAAPLALELEAEEGELLADGIVRTFELPPPPAYFTEEGLDQLKRCTAPMTLAGDRQQFGIVRLDVAPERDVLIAISNPPRPVRL